MFVSCLFCEVTQLSEAACQDCHSQHCLFLSQEASSESRLCHVGASRICQTALSFCSHVVSSLARQGLASALMFECEYCRADAPAYTGRGGLLSSICTVIRRSPRLWNGCRESAAAGGHHQSHRPLRQAFNKIISEPESWMHWVFCARQQLALRTPGVVN